MAKILLLSYGCEPGRGSEAGIGWQWVNHLSQQNEVFVLTHPRGRAAIQAQLAREPRPQLHVKYVELPRFIDPWRLLPGEQAIQFRYIMWQLAAYRAARKIVATEEIDLVHHVSWTTMTGPTLAWALDRPFIWGPVGSGQRAPLQMRRFLGLKGWLREAFRNTQVSTVNFNPLARAAASHSAVAFASNHDTYARLQQIGATDVRLQPDAAVPGNWLLPEPPPARDRERIVIAWASRMMARKSPGLAVEAFARLRAVHDAELWFIGDGPLIAETRAHAARLGLERDVKFWGWIDHERMPELLSEADIFLFTSLRDTCPMPVMEAMARGLPIVALDLHGVRYLPDNAVLKVPAEDPQRLVADVADALLDLALSPELRASCGAAAWASVRDGHLWTHRFAGVEAGYRAILGEPVIEPAWNERHGCAAD
jgi:glycosyltransferase involved in cell wall biosynthesis